MKLPHRATLFWLEVILVTAVCSAQIVPGHPEFPRVMRVFLLSARDEYCSECINVCLNPKSGSLGLREDKYTEQIRKAIVS